VDSKWTSVSIQLGLFTFDPSPCFVHQIQLNAARYSLYLGSWCFVLLLIVSISFSTLNVWLQFENWFWFCYDCFVIVVVGVESVRRWQLGEIMNWPWKALLYCVIFGLMTGCIFSFTMNMSGLRMGCKP